MKKASTQYQPHCFGYAWLMVALFLAIGNAPVVTAQMHHNVPDYSGNAMQDAAATNANMQRAAALLGNRPGIKKQAKYKFHIVFQNDSTCTVTGELDDLTGVYTLYVEKRDDSYLILPQDTKAIRSNGMDGVVMHNCWLFRIVKGKINAYSAYPDKKGPILGVQKGDGEILPFNARTMETFVADHKKAMAFVEDGDLYKALLYYND